MNIFNNALFSNITFNAIKDEVLPSAGTTRNKKIAAVALVVFAGLALFYLAFWIWRKKDNQSVQHQLGTEASPHNYYKPSIQHVKNYDDGRRLTTQRNADDPIVLPFSGYGYMNYPDGKYEQGNFLNDLLEGNGKRTYLDGTTLDGIFKSGQFVGPGTFRHPNGRLEEGNFLNDLLEGNGKRTYLDGTIIEGAFKGGRLDGKGTIRYFNGFGIEGEFKDGRVKKDEDEDEDEGDDKKTDDAATITTIDTHGEILEGELIDGKINGKAKVKYPDGRIEEGEFVDGLLNGNGSITYTNGTKLEGNFLSGTLDGKGTVINNGIISDGLFKKGILNGPAKKTYPDGKVEEGEFSNGTFVKGFGEIKLQDGTVALGTIQDGQLNGKGRATKPGGTIEDGMFVKGLLHGLGVRTFTTGRKESGNFYNGQLHGKGTKTDQWTIEEGDFSSGYLTRGKKSTYSHDPKLGRTLKNFQEGQFSNGTLYAGVITYSNGTKAEVTANSHQISYGYNSYQNQTYGINQTYNNTNNNYYVKWITVDGTATMCYKTREELQL